MKGTFFLTKPSSPKCVRSVPAFLHPQSPSCLAACSVPLPRPGAAGISKGSHRREGWAEPAAPAEAGCPPVFITWAIGLAESTGAP